MRAADLFDLLRVPNAPTAAADVLAAAFLGSRVLGTELDPWRLAAAGAASTLLYLGGMALNDVADADLDARERPARPIPSGRVGRGQATGITLLLFAVGLATAWWAGSTAFGVACLLLGFVVLYDTVLAGKPVVGPIGMGLCRACNWGFGLAVVGALGSFAILGAVLSFLYVFGLTHLSVGEVGGSPRSSLAVVSLTTLATLLVTVLVADHVIESWNAVAAARVALPLLAFVAFVSPALVRAWRKPVGSRIGPAVGALVGGITLLDAAMGGAPHSTLALLCFLPLFAAQIALRRHFRVS